MSALQCPATLLVARHGDADYPHAHVLSDDGGWLTDTGREQVRAMARALAPRNVARVYTSTMRRAVESGELAAAELGTDTVAVDGLQEMAVGALAGRPHDDPELAGVFAAWERGDLGRFIPGGETGQEVIERVREALQGIADLHRGETVLVLTHGGVMWFAVPRLPVRQRRDLLGKVFVPNAVPAEVSVDGDGFEVLSWPGSADRSVV